MLVRVGESGSSWDLDGVELPPVLVGVDFFGLFVGVFGFSVVEDEGVLLPFPGSSSKLSSSGVRINVTAPMVNRITMTYTTNVFTVDGSNAMPNIISGAVFVMDAINPFCAVVFAE